LSVMSASVEVGKYGRIVLPKEIREKYRVSERSRLIIREREGEIVLIPVRRYERPTDALYGSVKLERPVDEPKRVAREHLRRKLVEEMR
jgi:AbrB family looped-hinge helix DNA binding protein